MSQSLPSFSAARLYGILDLGYTPSDKLESTTKALIEGGADLIQLRAKNHPADEILAFGRRVRPICATAGVPFIVNDFPELAVELDADGLHLGQGDGSLAEARAMIDSSSKLQAPRSPLSAQSSPFIFGRSTHSPAQATAALEEGFDYIGFGPLFPTLTKQGRPGIGLDAIRDVESQVGSRIPMFCIGGIKRANLPQVLAAGALRVVIVSDLLTAPDIAAATRSAVEMLRGKR